MTTEELKDYYDMHPTECARATFQCQADTMADFNQDRTTWKCGCDISEGTALGGRHLGHHTKLLAEAQASVNDDWLEGFFAHVEGYLSYVEKLNASS